MVKPRILVISHVDPLRRSTGQEQRVHNTLKAIRREFHVTFAGLSPTGLDSQSASDMTEVADDVRLLSRRYGTGTASRIVHRGVGLAHTAATGLKFSNYRLGKLEFTARRMKRLIGQDSFDCVLFEYWHASDLTGLFRSRGTPCVLDTHNILWRAYEADLATRRLPASWKRWAVERYRRHEETAWSRFDAVIAINERERADIEVRVPSSVRVIYGPMGVELAQWPYSWEPVDPPRLVFYGGMAGPRNRAAALRCHDSVMPGVWDRYPSAELWIVGGNPPSEIQNLASSPRVQVTGFVRDVKTVLKTGTAMLCPWRGAFGFRSRIAEAMALGLPVLTTPDGVDGMNLVDGQGVTMCGDDNAMIEAAVTALGDADYSREQSLRARAAIVEQYSFDATYGALAAALRNLVDNPRSEAAEH